MFDSLPLPAGWLVALVGGVPRDQERARLAGSPPPRPHDLDFVVVGPGSLAEMVAGLRSVDFVVHTETAETLTARCRVPASLPSLLALARDADFALGRRESGIARSGRKPGSVAVARSLAEDLARRDFTVNAMARPVLASGLGDLVDLHGGLADLAAGVLRFVGDPALRLQEDPLRVLRAFRFAVCKGFALAPETADVLASPLAADLLVSVGADGAPRVPAERVFEELALAYHADTLVAARLLARFPLLEEVVLGLVPLGPRMAAGRARLG